RRQLARVQASPAAACASGWRNSWTRSPAPAPSRERVAVKVEGSVMLPGAVRPPPTRLPAWAAVNVETFRRVEIKHAVRLKSFRAMQSFHTNLPGRRPHAPGTAAMRDASATTADDHLATRHIPDESGITDCGRAARPPYAGLVSAKSNVSSERALISAGTGR